MARDKREFVERAGMTSAEIAAYLSERERRFADEFNRCLNGTQAAIAVGYTAGKNNASAAVTACRLLRDPRVRAYRLAVVRESVEDMALSKDSVILKLLEIYQRCMAATPVLQYNSDTKSWEESGEWRFDAKGATRAIEQISKILGYDAPVRVEGADGGAVKIMFSDDARNDGG